MKNVIKGYFAVSILTLSMAACTMGDKGEGHVTDSTSMDTSRSGSSGAGGGGGGMSGGGGGTSGGSGTSSSDPAAGGTGSLPRDTTQKDRSPNGGADFKPNDKKQEGR